MQRDQFVLFNTHSTKADAMKRTSFVIALVIREPPANTITEPPGSLARDTER
jgi:hypothetical protein